MAISHWIDNDSVSSSSTFDVKSSSDDSLIHKVSSADDAIIEQAVASAHKAFRSWKETPIQQRQKIFLKAADLLAERANVIVDMMQKET